ncbi:hypothetical protein MIZ03_1544 [Rhodoferax lithotrophicus]|uniref:Uncharacterized protein n=1 Tax=Rhodoferax lithotrophicus TaxID=2798804 RepID=A0ABM7MK83_9BURK|nr:hypothetical protein MIZ03_1544 [Rhodoferax sp. MIZ03]
MKSSSLFSETVGIDAIFMVADYAMAASGKGCLNAGKITFIGSTFRCEFR